MVENTSNAFTAAFKTTVVISVHVINFRESGFRVGTWRLEKFGTKSHGVLPHTQYSGSQQTCTELWLTLQEISGVTVLAE